MASDTDDDVTLCLRQDWDRWTILNKSITILYTVICLVFTLVMRLYLHAYYSAAFVAGWGILITAFVLWDNVCQIKNSLGCSLKVFTAYEVVLNSVYLTCCVIMTIGYTVLTAISLHINYDYAVATGFSCVNALFLVYLLIVSAMAYRAARSSTYALRKNSLVWTTHIDGNGYEFEMDLENDHNKISDNYMRSMEMTSSGNSYRCCSCCASKHMNICIKLIRFIWRVFVAIIYYPMTLLIFLLLAFSSCHPYFVIIDTLQYREPNDMYTVEVEGHRPLSLFLKCTGNGDTTIIYENGLGGMAYMQWEFMPQMLKDQYTVCVHDRRGYGWSEGASHDNFQLLWKQPQWSKINSQFFIKLVEKANITRPFYYMGHSYGGSHLIYTYRQRPDLLKGLIFFDSVEFDVARTLQKNLELVINFQPSGLFYVLFNSGLFDLRRAFDGVGDFSEVSQSTLNQLISALTSGTYLESYLREWWPLKDESSIYYTHPAIISNTKQVDLPTLVIDQAGRPYWFPDENFDQYNKSFYAQVAETSHTTLVYSMNKTKVTANLVNNFVQYAEGLITFNDYITNKNLILGT